MSEEAAPYVVTGDNTPRYLSPMAVITSPILIFNLDYKIAEFNASITYTYLYLHLYMPAMHEGQPARPEG